MQDVPAGAPKMRVYSPEDIQNNPGIAYSGGRSPRDPDDDDDEPDEDEDEDDVESSQVSATYGFESIYLVVQFHSLWSGSWFTAFIVQVERHPSNNQAEKDVVATYLYIL